MASRLISTHNQGFTIVELLVAIAVIGVLAAITAVSYTGIFQRANAVSLVSDLEGASTRLRLYQVENSAYPNSVSDCPTPVSGNLCLVASSGTTYQYAVDNVSSPQAFSLIATKSTLKYSINSDSKPAVFTPVIATGGSISDVGGYRIHSFESSDSFTVTGGGYVEYLIVAGGGGGQSNTNTGTNTGGGGGGGGGYVVGGSVVSAGGYPVIVGNGGSNTADITAQGGNSSAFSRIAIGGGRGANRNLPGVNGGSGGGGGYTYFNTPGLGTLNQGYAGGNATMSGNFGGGGGGGASSVGMSGNDTNGGNGGAGFFSSISGVLTGYCGGGGGAIGFAIAGMEGKATHGGGDGGSGVQSGQNARSNSGGGGGGSSGSVQSTGLGGNGGSGVVIIRYPMQ
jgi:prepilin-type N-terminal cleavage/methylation domain-containing protein